MMHARLGIHYEITVRTGADDAATVCERFRLQSVARSLLPGERVAGCMRYVAPYRDRVEVRYNEGERRSHFSGLLLCDSVWVCPVCASRRAMAARDELRVAVGSGFVPFLATFTLSHRRGEPLADVLDRVKRSFQDLLSGRAGMGLREKYGVVGSIAATEVTYGENGWHPHLHVIYLLRGPAERGEWWLYDALNRCEYRVPRELKAFEHVVADSLQFDLLSRWSGLVAKNGGYANGNGVDVRSGDGWVADYVSKYGRLPHETRGRDKWGVVEEVAFSVRKRGRDGNAGPWELLERAGAGDVDAAARFQEYAAVFKGRRRLRWSKGLRQLLGLSVDEPTMVDLVDVDDAVSVVLASLNRDQWRVVMANDARGALLEVAASGDMGRVGAFLLSLRGWAEVNGPVSIQDGPGVRDSLFWCPGT